MGRKKGDKNIKDTLRNRVTDAVASGKSLKDISNSEEFQGSNPSTLTQYFYYAKRLLKGPSE